MKFMHVNPILYSSNLQRSLSYYTEALVFENKWEWGDPPTFGGVMKDAVQIFLCEGGQGHPGTWLSIMTTDVDEYFEKIRSRGARIVSEPKTMEWGIREMLVEDPDGHRIRFGHGVGPERTGKRDELPASVRIVHRRPTSAEYRQLAISVGWAPGEDQKITDDALSAAVYAVVARWFREGPRIKFGSAAATFGKHLQGDRYRLGPRVYLCFFAYACDFILYITSSLHYCYIIVTC